MEDGRRWSANGGWEEVVWQWRMGGGGLAMEDGRRWSGNGRWEEVVCHENFSPPEVS